MNYPLEFSLLELQVLVTLGPLLDLLPQKLLLLLLLNLTLPLIVLDLDLHLVLEVLHLKSQSTA